MALAVDIGLGLILLLSIIAGMRNGFADSLFSVASWLGGAILALYLPRAIVPHLPSGVRGFPGIAILTGVLIFLATFFVVRLLGVAVTGNGKPKPGPIDRMLGLMIGIARGLIIGAIIASFLVAYLPPEGTVMRKSRALPLLLPAGRIVAGVAPEKIRGRMDQGWDRVKQGSAPERRGPVSV